MQWRLIRWTGFMIQMSTNSKVAQEGELKKKDKNRQDDGKKKKNAKWANRSGKALRPLV